MCLVMLGNATWHKGIYSELYKSMKRHKLQTEALT